MLIEFIKTDFQFNDERGALVQLVHDGWKQINYISSKKNVVRGGHYHKNNKEAFYVISGSFKLIAEDVNGVKEEYSIKAGDFFIVKPFIKHSFHFEEDTCIISFYDKGVEEGEIKDIYPQWLSLGGGVEEDKITFYRELHQKSKDYGVSGVGYINIIQLAISSVQPKTVLDYGCGKGELVAQLKKLYPAIKFYGYDPAIDEFNTLPKEKRIDLIINTDVLEHIPEECLPSVIERISMISQNCLFVLSHVTAVQVLSNGENAHCTVKGPFYYWNLFSKYFKTVVPFEMWPRYGRWNSLVITFKPDYDFYKNYEGLCLLPLPEREEHIKQKEEYKSRYYRRLIKFLSNFLLKKEARHIFREKYMRKK